MTDEVGPAFEKGQTANISAVYNNSNVELIHITVDKLRVILANYKDALENRKAWIAPVSVSIALITTIVTTKFKDFIFSASVWNAIFVISFVFSFLLSVLWGIRSFKSKKIEDLIDDIKNKSS